MAYTTVDGVDAEGKPTLSYWEPCEPNEFHQRQLRCVRGPRKGKVMLSPIADGPPPVDFRRAQHPYDSEPRTAHGAENWMGYD